MSTVRAARWTLPAFALVAGTALVGLVLLGPPAPNALGADLPTATAGYQTTEQLVIIVKLPPAGKDTRARDFTVELIGPKDKVVQKVTPKIARDAESVAVKFRPTKLAIDKL